MKNWLKQVGTIAAGVFAGLALTAIVGGIIFAIIAAVFIHGVSNELQKTSSTTPSAYPTYTPPSYSPTPAPMDDDDANMHEGDGTIDGTNPYK